MSQYLLLRDNKQSGPYSFEELTLKGLKGYDLIWIEGKSAAWRYPSEIQEFKPFAPLVEEQPYDRFYKRPDNSNEKKSTEPTTVNASGKLTASSSGNVANPDMAKVAETAQTNKNQTISTGINRRIVVILPGGMNADKASEKVIFHETVENKIAHPEKKPTNIRETTRSVPPEVKDYVTAPGWIDYKNESLAAERSRLAKPGILQSRTPKIIAGTFFLVMIGVIIGWAFSRSITDNKLISPVVTPKETVIIPESQSVFNNESAQTVENQVTTAENDLPGDDMVLNANQEFADSPVSGLNSKVFVARKPHVKSKKVVPVTEPQQNTVPILETAEQSNTTATDNEEAEKRAVKKNISELIRVSKNEFKTGAFGGISDLQLKVTNSSPYTVDLVVVEVKYLLANKKEFKTENVYFKNLAPGTSVTGDAPKSTRGIQVSSKVALITSKALGMYQASL